MNSDTLQGTAAGTGTSPGMRSGPFVPTGRRKRRQLFAPKRLLIWAVTGFYVLTTLGAFVWVAVQALKTNSEFISTSPWSLPADAQWMNFVEIWQRSGFASYFFNSVIVSVTSAASSVVVAGAAAYAVSRIDGVRAAEPIKNGFLLGIMMPAVLTVVPLYFVFNDLGLLNSRLGLIIIYTAVMLPFSVYYLSAYFENVPKELEEAASIDGASPITAILRVFTPVVVPGLVAVMLINLLWGWNEFFYALIFLSDRSMFTMSMGLYELQVSATYSAQWVPVFAGMLLTVTPMLLLYLAASDQITRGMTEGAVKG